MQRRVRAWACTATGIEHIKKQGRGTSNEGQGYLYRRRSFNRDSFLIDDCLLPQITPKARNISVIMIYLRILRCSRLKPVLSSTAINLNIPSSAGFCPSFPKVVAGPLTAARSAPPSSGLRRAINASSLYRSPCTVPDTGCAGCVAPA